MNFFSPHFFKNPKKLFHKKAKVLQASNKKDLEEAANIIKKGGIVAFPFNGIYGLFGDITNKKAADKIYVAKNRPKDKKLIMVTAPEFLEEYAKTDHLHFGYEKLIDLWKNIHALGVILPSSHLMPVTIENDGTVLTIWTEYEPLRYTLEEFRKMGGTAFIGTSANKSGQPTHFEPKTLWKDFSHDVDAIVEADFSHLDDSRKKSTTVIDMTSPEPKLHRVGNVSREELVDEMKRFNLPDLSSADPLIIVQGRNKK